VAVINKQDSSVENILYQPTMEEIRLWMCIRGSDFLGFFLNFQYLNNTGTGTVKWGNSEWEINFDSILKILVVIFLRVFLHDSAHE
jgi:hypothetical protein